MHPEAGAQLIEGLVFAQRGGDRLGPELRAVPFPRPFARRFQQTHGCLSQLSHWLDFWGALHPGQQNLSIGRNYSQDVLAIAAGIEVHVQIPGAAWLGDCRTRTRHKRARA
jgi:hypothetical protein